MDRLAAKWNPVKVIEDFIGAPITDRTPSEITAWPEEQKEVLFERLCEASKQSNQRIESTEWLNNDSLSFGQLDSVCQEFLTQLSLPNLELRQQLLYLPSILVTDPFGELLSELNSLDLLFRGFEGTMVEGKPQLRPLYDGWLTSLCRLVPAFRRGYVELVIRTSGKPAIDVLEKRYQAGLTTQLKDKFAWMFREVAADLALATNPNVALNRLTDSYWDDHLEIEPISFFRDLAESTERASEVSVCKALESKLGDALNRARQYQAKGQKIPWDCGLAIAAIYFSNWSHRMLATTLASHLQLGARSVIAARSTEPLLAAFGLDPLQIRMPSKQRAAGRVLGRYRLPSIDKASFEQIISIRESQEVFADFRRLLGVLLDEVERLNPNDQTQFELEFEQAIEDTLLSEIQRLQKATKSSILEKILVPGALSLSGGAIIYEFTGAFPASAAVAASLAPAGLIADLLIKRYSKTGKHARALSSAFITLKNIGTKSGTI